MDTITQALLGATVGQAATAKTLGRRGIWWGAAGGLLPDLDVLAGISHGPFGELLYHRGPTHALWFGPAIGPLLALVVWSGYAATRRYRQTEPSPGEFPNTPLDPGERRALVPWIRLFVLALLTHPLLDVFTTYGTQLLAPFDLQRFALHGVSIIDPIYSGVLAAGLWIGRKRPVEAKRRIAGIALLLSTLYLFVGVELNRWAERDVREQLAETSGIEAKVRAYPTFLQPFLRRVVARSPDEVYVGLHSTFAPGRSLLESFRPLSHPLVDRLRATPEGALFEWFAMGETTARVTPSGDELIVEIDDLRYGMTGLAPADRGMWGVRASFDQQGNLIDEVRRSNRERIDTDRGVFQALWRGTWGDLGGFKELLKKEHP
ncbi:metal-dependent hydrolase [Myxococcota bacterium]|nr:metal-dependent hydrolase [Myxococcota bacterium]